MHGARDVEQPRIRVGVRGELRIRVTHRSLSGAKPDACSLQQRPESVAQRVHARDAITVVAHEPPVVANSLPSRSPHDYRQLNVQEIGRGTLRRNRRAIADDDRSRRERTPTGSFCGLRGPRTPVFALGSTCAARTGACFGRRPERMFGRPSRIGRARVHGARTGAGSSGPVRPSPREVAACRWRHLSALECCRCSAARTGTTVRPLALCESGVVLGPCIPTALISLPKLLPQDLLGHLVRVVASGKKDGALVALFRQGHGVLGM